VDDQICGRPRSERLLWLLTVQEAAWRRAVSIGLVKLSRRAESILDRTLRFFDEYRPINRSRCGVCGGSDSRASLLLASTCGYSQHRVRLRRPVRRQPMIVSADASPSLETVRRPR
jgi:hypothetical protein